jgi:hypothetical protein
MLSGYLLVLVFAVRYVGRFQKNVELLLQKIQNSSLFYSNLFLAWMSSVDSRGS